MASVSKFPLRRMAHTTCLRRAASSRASFSSSSTCNNETTQTTQKAPTSTQPEKNLAILIEEFSGEEAPQDFSSSPTVPTQTVHSSPRMALFNHQSFLRPIDLRRDFREPRSIRRRPPPIGPGREARYKDIFLQHGIDPRFECENTTLMSDLSTRMGKIQPRNVTLLSQRSQRLVGKAIKRAKMMGIVPVFSNKRWK